MTKSIKFIDLLAKFQANYGTTHDNIFYEIIMALSKEVTSKETFLSKRNVDIDFKYKDYEKMLTNYFKKEMPLAHVVGSAEFLGLRFKVSKKVLSPRDTTEQMVKDFIEAHKKDNFHEVWDLCSGCGVIGISIKKYIPQFNVVCVDRYFAPFIDTVMNAKANDTLIKADCREAIDYLNARTYQDIIISNPPYVNGKNFNNVKMFRWENKKALIADENGLYFFRRYFDYLEHHPFNEAWFEYGYDQRQVIEDLLKTYQNITFEMPADKQYIVIKPKQA